MNPVTELTVFFPFYNEEGNIERVVATTIDKLERLGLDYQVILIDDGSRDQTGAIADRLANANPRIEVVHHRPNRGYGGALQSGFRNAKKDWVFYTDGDGQFDIDELDRVLALADSYDIVSGYRINRQDGFMRKLNAALWGIFVRRVLGLSIRDIDCAFKLYRTAIFRTLEMKSTGALIDAEILARASRAGYRIGQVGVHHHPREAGVQTGANLRVIARAFREILRLRRDILSTPRAAQGS